MIFIPMVKAVSAERIVVARIDETPDTSAMIMDYATSKPHFEAWSERLRKASDGKNLGNVRAMHQLVAAGKCEAVVYDDAAKAIEFTIRVVDDDEWKKVEAGVYTGVSPGGSYKKRWSDGKYTRYTAGPSELSLVDLPCKPEGTFTMVKADGAEEQLPFKPGDSLGALTEALLKAESPADYRGILLASPAPVIGLLFAEESLIKVAEAQGLAKRDFSEDARKAAADKGHAMPDGSYPIDDKTDLAHAIEAYGRAKDKDGVKALIAKRAKALGATELLPADWDGSTRKMAKAETACALKKGLSDVGRLASLIEGMSRLAACVTAEAAAEADASPLPGKLAGAIETLSSILVDLATEESKEALEGLRRSIATIPGAVMQYAERAGELAKAGARHSKADLDRVQAIHDHASDLGASCGESMEKAAGCERLLGAAFELAGAREKLGKIEGENATLKKRVAELERQPQHGGPALRQVVVDRASDTGTPALDAKAQTELKQIEAMKDGPDKTAKLVRFAMEHPEAPRAPARR